MRRTPSGTGTPRHGPGSKRAPSARSKPVRPNNATNGTGTGRRRSDRERPADQERQLSDTLLESLPGIYYVYGTDMVLRHWNRNFERVTGYRGEELKRMSPLDLFGGSDRDLIAARIRDVFRKGHSDAEADIISRDGRRTPYYLTGVRARIDGESCLLGVGIDLTELRHTQQRLAESEQRLREIFEAANVGIAVAGPDDRFVQVNPGLCTMLGYSREELQRLRTFDLVHPDDREESRRITRDVHAGRLDSHRAERRYVRKDGSVIWVNVYAQTVFDEARRQRHSVGIIIDITERRRASDALRDSELRYQLANRATFNAIWDWDLTTDRLWWNDTFLSLFGYRAEEIEPGIESWTRRIHPADLERVRRGIHAAIDSGLDTWRDEYRFRRADGSYAEVEDRGYIMHGADGRPLRMIGAMQEITDRKRAEDELRKKEEHLRLALDAAQMATFDWDMTTDEIIWRHTSSDWLGVGPGVIHDKAERFLSLVHPDDRAGVQEKIARCIATRGNYSNELRMIWPDGSVHWVLSLASFDYDSSGNAVRMRGIVMETTARRRAEEALRLFRTLLDRANDPVEVIDPATGRFLDVNDTFCRTLGYSREQVLAMGVPDVDPSCDPQSWPERIGSLRDARATVAEGWHRRRDGTTFPVEISMAWVRLDRDYIVASVRDISERRHAEESIRRLNRIHAVLSGINSLIVRERDRNRLFYATCRIVVEKGGFAAAWIGTPDADDRRIVPLASFGAGFVLPPLGPGIPDGRSDAADFVGRAVRSGKPLFVNSLRQEEYSHLVLLGLADRDYKSAAALPLHTHGRVQGVLVLYGAENAFFDTAEIPLLTELAGDISFSLEYMENQERIQYMAFHEPLTGLANRTFLLSRLREAIEQSRDTQAACAVLLMDLNNFRSVNNSLGPHNGDALLRSVAARLRATVWDQDIVACLGGDEFGVLLPRLASPADVDVVVRKVTAAMNEVFIVADLPVSVELRVGYAIYPQHADNAELLWQRASVALRTAKDRHRIAIEYDARIDHYDPRNLTLLGGLRAAIDRNELVLHYQPKIDLRTMSVVGVEALVRWQHPQRGMIFPDGFMALAEQTTLIGPVTQRILALAMTQCRIWLQHGHSLCIAVNLSARNLLDPCLCDDIVALARRNDFPLSHLILEITESAIMTDPELGRSVLARLRDAGITLSMDDFGIGQSSLAYLRDLPVNQVKIDKSFVMGIGEKRNATIVRAAIDLAHSLDLKVTAEGVEDESALAVLREWQCDTAQGYYICRPLPANGLETWLAGWQPR